MAESELPNAEASGRRENAKRCEVVMTKQWAILSQVLKHSEWSEMDAVQRLNGGRSFRTRLSSERHKI